MKKIFSIIISLSVLLSLAACGTPSNSDVQTPSNVSPDSSSSQQGTINSKDASIVETILLDEAGVKITAKSLGDSMWGSEVKILIENNSEKNLTVQARNSSINGYMVENMLSADVAAGKKANDSITFMSSDMELCGIEAIASMEFSFHIFTTDDWETYLDTSVIQLKTSIADTYTQTYDDSGDVAYDKSGVKIVIKGLSTDDSLLGPSILVYIENNSQQNITVQTRDVSINDFMLDPIFSCDVAPGKRAVDTITFMSSELEDNNISAIETVELSFHIFDYSDWETIADTDTITIDF